MTNFSQFYYLESGILIQKAKSETLSYGFTDQYGDPCDYEKLRNHYAFIYINGLHDVTGHCEFHGQKDDKNSQAATEALVQSLLA